VRLDSQKLIALAKKARQTLVPAYSSNDDTSDEPALTPTETDFNHQDLLLITVDLDD
jgi:hypothetical protein